MFEYLREGDDPMDAYGKAAPVYEKFYDYLDTLADSLIAEFSLSDEEAFSYIEGFADQLAAKGSMPPFPDDESNVAVMARWMGAADYRGFKDMLYNYVRQAEML